jgi:hypothetical protein
MHFCRQPTLCPHGGWVRPDLRQMLHNAGFRSSEKQDLMPDFFTVVVGHK